MKSLQILRTQFDGGMVNDPRNTRTNVCRICTNFDIFTDPKRMIPYRDSESGDAGSATSQKQNFCIALWGPTSTYRLFSLGVQSGNTKAEILMKALTTGGSADLGDSAWLTPANNQSGSGATSLVFFVYYATTGKIYGAKAGTTIWTFTPDGSTVFDDTGHSLSYTNIAQGLVHSKDDCMYVPYDNKIARNNNGSWTDAALTLPANCKITSICEDGNYLTIATAPISGIGNSVVYRWDRDASLATISEKIDWGEGSLNVVETLEGYLIGISVSGNNSTRNKAKITCSYYSSSLGVVKFAEYMSENAAATLLQVKQKADKRIYFMMSIKLNGAVREGVWSVGRSSSGVPFGIAHERTPNNDTALGSGVLKSFFLVGEFLFQSYVDNSSVYQLSKTNDAESYTATAILETLIYNNGDSSQSKKMLGVTAMNEPLAAAGSIAMLYKKDSETSFTEIFADTMDNDISHSAVNIESSGTNLPEEKEVSFRLESTGGAVITGWSFEPDFVDRRIY